MTEPIGEVTLGTEGLDYLRECLSIGKALSQAALETVELASGILTALLPGGLAEEEVNCFWSGGKMGEDTIYGRRNSQTMRFGRVHNTSALFQSMIVEHLESDSSAFCILEDQLASPGDQKLRDVPAPKLSDGQSVYYLLSAAHTDRRAIEATFNRAMSIRPPIIGFLARDSVDVFLKRSDQLLDGPGVRHIAERTEQILVGAYDGESFLRWRRVAKKR